MRLPEIRNLIIKNVDLPASQSEVVDAIGDECLETPQGDEEQLSDVIDRCGVEEFRSVDEVYDSIVGNVSAGHVGRQGYDDRGPNLIGDDEEVSF